MKKKTAEDLVSEKTLEKQIILVSPIRRILERDNRVLQYFSGAKVSIWYKTYALVFSLKIKRKYKNVIFNGFRNPTRNQCVIYRRVDREERIINYESYLEICHGGDGGYEENIIIMLNIYYTVRRWYVGDDEWTDAFRSASSGLYSRRRCRPFWKKREKTQFARNFRVSTPSRWCRSRATLSPQVLVSCWSFDILRHETVAITMAFRDQFLFYFFRREDARFGKMLSCLALVV